MSVINTDAQQGLKADVYIENLSHHAQLKCMTECLDVTNSSVHCIIESGL